MRLVIREEFDRHAVNTLKGFDRTPPKYFNNSQQNKRNRIQRFFCLLDAPATINQTIVFFINLFPQLIKEVICIAGNFKILTG